MGDKTIYVSFKGRVKIICNRKKQCNGKGEVTKQRELERHKDKSTRIVKEKEIRRDK